MFQGGHPTPFPGLNFPKNLPPPPGGFPKPGSVKLPTSPDEETGDSFAAPPSTGQPMPSYQMSRATPSAPRAEPPPKASEFTDTSGAMPGGWENFLQGVAPIDSPGSNAKPSGAATGTQDAFRKFMEGRQQSGSPSSNQMPSLSEIEDHVKNESELDKDKPPADIMKWFFAGVAIFVGSVIVMG